MTEQTKAERIRAYLKANGPQTTRQLMAVMGMSFAQVWGHCRPQVERGCLSFDEATGYSYVRDARHYSERRTPMDPEVRRQREQARSRRRSERLKEQRQAERKAPSIGGGHWCRVANGWKWNGPEGSGSTFPRPGGAWTGELIAPAAPPRAAAQVDRYAEDWAAFLERAVEEVRAKHNQVFVRLWDYEAALIAKHLRRLAPAATDSEDAARYRWLRECDQEQEDLVMLRKNCGCGGDELCSGEELDAAIDAMLKTEASNG